jgi:FkbM family methyltransferase
LAATVALGIGSALLSCDRGSQPLEARDARRPTAGAAPDVVLSIEGVGEIPMFLNPNDQVVTPAIQQQRLWEPNETHWFVRSVGQGDVVVDVGANVGYYTLIAGHLVGESGRVYAFEPDPESFSLLERNVRLNGLTNVVLEQKAASNEAGALRLYLAEKNRGDHRIFQIEGEDRAFVEVEAVALDDYFGDRANRIDFVKIDTQGAEMMVLQGMDTILRANEGLVMAVEYAPRLLHRFGVEPSKLVDLLTAYDFRFFDLNFAPTVGLPEVTRDGLRKTYRIRHWGFTNLLCVKSGVAELGPGSPGFPRPSDGR